MTLKIKQTLPPTPCHSIGAKMLQCWIWDRFGYCVSTQQKKTILVWYIHSGLIYISQNICAELGLHAGHRVCYWLSWNKCRAWLWSKAEHSLHCMLHYTSSVAWKCVRHRACLKPWVCDLRCGPDHRCNCSNVRPAQDELRVGPACITA